MNRLPFFALLPLLSFLPSVSCAEPDRPIEPLLRTYCIGCHNEADHEGGVSFQLPQSIKSGGDNGPILNPIDARDSILFKVLAAGTDASMPPEGEPQPTAKERQALLDWVLAGSKTVPMATGIPDVPAVKPFAKAATPPLALKMLRDGSKLFSAGNRFIQAVDASQKTLWKATDLQGKATSLSLSGDEKRLAVGIGFAGVSGGARLLDSETGKTLTTFGGHTDAVYAVALSADAQLIATGGYDRKILIHSVKTGDIIQTLTGHNGSILGLNFSPSGQVLCSASADGTVKVWNVATGIRLDTLSQPQAEQYAVHVSADGKRIYAAGADNRIRIWQLESRDKPTINPQLTSKFAHEQAITHLATSPDDSRLASIAEDGSIRIWASWPFAPIASLPVQSEAITAATFASNSTLLVSLKGGGAVSLKIPELPAEATNAASNTAMASTAIPGELKSVG